MTPQEWILFAYITAVMLMQVFQYYIYPIWQQRKTIAFDSGPMAGVHMKPDERGILGTLTDSNGNKYYAVLIAQEDFNMMWDESQDSESEQL